MDYSMSLHGRLYFDTPAIAQIAREEVRELLMEEDPEFRDALLPQFFEGFVQRDTVVDVGISLRGPEHFWFGIESLAEALTLRASDGHLEGYNERFEPDVERFLPGGKVA